jgi:hypothetical protein
VPTSEGGNLTHAAYGLLTAPALSIVKVGLEATGPELGIHVADAPGDIQSAINERLGTCAVACQPRDYRGVPQQGAVVKASARLEARQLVGGYRESLVA